MIYLDNGATSFPKPPAVNLAMLEAMDRCGNPGRGGYPLAMHGAQVVYRCRKRVAEFFECEPEQVVFTSNCTQGLNMAIRTLFKPGDRVVISGFEHNAVSRPLHGLGCEMIVAGRKLFDWENTLEEFEKVMRAFKTQDPNGNGVADEIGFTGSTGGWNEKPVNFLMNSFIYDDFGDGFVLENDKISLNYTSEKYKEGLKYISSLFIGVTSAHQYHGDTPIF